MILAWSWKLLTNHKWFRFDVNKTNPIWKLFEPSLITWRNLLFRFSHSRNVSQNTRQGSQDEKSKIPKMITRKKLKLCWLKRSKVVVVKIFRKIISITFWVLVSGKEISQNTIQAKMQAKVLEVVEYKSVLLYKIFSFN